MRTWNHTLYLDAIPGRTRRDRRRGDFAEWLREMEEHRISTVVCLAPDEQIAAGVGRTGMFAVAVLLKLGYPYDEALAEITAVGSCPETRQQREFLRNEDSEG